MKNIILITLTLLSAACVKEEIQGGDQLSQGNTVLTATLDEVSRTVLNDGSVLWQQGDCINVITKSSKNCGSYSLIEGEGTTSGRFRGGDIPESSEYYALYPYQTGLTKVNGKYNFRIPQDQTWQENSFGQGAGFMVATFTDPAEPLQFKNVLGLLKLSLTGTTKVYRITVSDGNSERMLWGNAALTLDGTQGTAGQTLELTNGSNSVNLLCPNGVQLSDNPSLFYIALPQGALATGMTVQIYGEKDILLDSFSTAKNNSIERSQVRAMPVRDLVFNLSIIESANSYIIYRAGKYKLKAVKGNSDESIGTATGASLLWETRNSANAPAANSIISDVSCSDGYVQFTATGLSGNAGIAATDIGGNILWSWHIWIPSTSVEALARESDFLMDRNLGAIDAIPSGDGVSTIGMFYEWGRKDPFPGSANWSSTGTISYIGTTGSEFSRSVRTDEKGTLEYATAHPQEYLFYNNDDKDWLCTSDDGLWAAAKTIYDPCPPGYHVPSFTDWSACSATFTAETIFGAYVNYYGNNTSWFPCGGYRFASDGANHSSGKQCYYWSYTVNGHQSRGIMMKAVDGTKTTGTIGRSVGANLRCIASTLPPAYVEPIATDEKFISVNGTVSCGNSPVAGVVVSDGVEVTVTDADGFYELASKKEKGYVFISIPSGYRVPTVGANTPQFWKSISGGASTLETIDFTLDQDTDQQKFKFIAIGDIQVNNLTNGDDIRQFNEVFAPDFQNYLASHSNEKMFVLTLGDHSWNDYWADHNFNLDDFKAMWDAKVNGIQVFYTPGNHDNDRGQNGVFPTTNDESKRKYRSLFGPSNYSFNMGAFHFIALDNVWCYNIGQQDGTKSRGTMSYKFYITDEQLEWVEKDLAHVGADTPLIISAHAPFFKFNGTDNLSENSTSRLISLLGGRRAYLFSGHTHMVYNVDHMADKNVFEFNNGGLAGATYHVNNFATSSDGSPCGYRIIDVNGTSLNWIYKGYKEDDDFQFRVYDRNEVCLAPAQWIPSCTNEEALTIWNQRVSWYLEPRTDNLVVINVWDWDPEWTVEILEGSTPLEVEHVALDSSHDAERMDPLFLATYEANAFNANKTSAGSFRAFPYAHIFRAQASSSTSTVTVKVTNRFGRVFTKTIQRPYVFSIADYNP
ncbi:MAG: calcineurin-like phosphoesterase C-terminal domain-containing protein [Bacteroidales bacterium]|nr:calcineurin-like phosphoesterase C-terminal domain-containing protein [Bacteroidales bacterium]